MHKWYGDFYVLKGIDLHIASGEIVVVCGPSGSGKSTLIRCLNLLEDFQKGHVFIEGTELTRDAACVAAKPTEFFDNPQHERAREFLSQILSH
eukprot:gene6501-7531_t